VFDSSNGYHNRTDLPSMMHYLSSKLILCAAMAMAMMSCVKVAAVPTEDAVSIVRSNLGDRRPTGAVATPTEAPQPYCEYCNVSGSATCTCS